ncbi:cation transporter [Corynebacterium sanguinis]|uniref:cation transporter n=1 Tax=Corynebacterium TaxID=1716 RepID=UPI0011A77245|nr:MULTISPECIES: cation transporter [Corynebacterium]MCT2287851.1 cation transporter [Corynebacterium sanguinis]TVS22546.1 cation transporter [Corynebacterium sanguinis]TVS23715.1 cation transporter [Corynebacterium sanguinis]TVS27036.1 cation transporter [Corynebacterium sanguinis]WNI13950.1 cation transporter [Corynebacterium sp. Z-1]
MSRAVLIVALLNLAYFVVEVVAAAALGSAALLADSVDFLEDTAINLLVFVAVAWPAARRRVAAKVLAGLIVLPAIAALVMVVYKVLNPVPPAPEGLTLVAAGALVVNVICALILLKVRGTGVALATGAWLAARNDALSNVLIIIAGLLTFVYATAWFDIAVGLIIAVLNLSAAKEVWEEAD